MDSPIDNYLKSYGFYKLGKSFLNFHDQTWPFGIIVALITTGYRDEPIISRAELSTAGILRPRGAPTYGI
jgi:hypothetical protein